MVTSYKHVQQTVKTIPYSILEKFSKDNGLLHSDIYVDEGLVRELLAERFNDEPKYLKELLEIKED